MAQAPEGKQGSGLLRYFGLETRAKALSVVGWAAPYLGLLGVGFAGLSYLVNLIIPLSLWVYLVASTLAIAYFFFFLARMRQIGAEAEARSHAEQPEGNPP
jgi:hypothetical protein